MATGRDREEEERKKGKKKKGRCFPLSLLSVSGSLKWSWCSSVSHPVASPAPATPQGSEPALRGDVGRAWQRPSRQCPMLLLCAWAITSEQVPQKVLFTHIIQLGETDLKLTVSQLRIWSAFYFFFF